jgi:hypothetical protein
VQYDAWKALIPSLVEPLLSYVGRSSGNATPHKVDIAPCSLCVGTETSRIMCLFWDRNKREPPGEAETLGGVWGVVQGALANFLEVRILRNLMPPGGSSVYYNTI